jgi:NADPH-dependent glutamate synthase beta subunit-like oxidoreductase
MISCPGESDSAYKFRISTPENIGTKVLVVGGGNTAMDSARAALRLQKNGGLHGYHGYLRRTS